MDDLKKALLTTVYDVYSAIEKDFPSACRKSCSVCCTRSVLATSLEAQLIVESMSPEAEALLWEDFEGNSAGVDRTRPTLTINDLAARCMEQQESPHETQPLRWGRCPLRSEEGCTVYAVRPFSCRIMRSSTLCENSGQALMDPQLVSIAGALEQLIEDIDCGGTYGNLLDHFQESCRPSSSPSVSGNLLSNRPNPGFIVPPEHRQTVAGVLGTLFSREVAGMPFKQALKTVKQQREVPAQGKDFHVSS